MLWRALSKQRLDAFDLSFVEARPHSRSRILRLDMRVTTTSYETRLYCMVESGVAETATLDSSSEPALLD